MSDRANILVKKDHADIGVYLYTHSTGYELPETLQSALVKRRRWDDAQYLTRIIFCEMIQGAETSEAGFGLSARVGDGDDRVLTVDVEKQTVTASSGASWSFKDYISLTKEDFKELHF